MLALAVVNGALGLVSIAIARDAWAAGKRLGAALYFACAVMSILGCLAASGGLK